MPSLSTRLAFYIYLLALVCVSAITYGYDVQWEKQDKAVLIGLLAMIGVLIAFNVYRLFFPIVTEDKFAHKAVIRREYV